MPKITTVEISLELLDFIFNEFGIWQKIKDGCLSSERRKPKPSYIWPNATAFIIKHNLPNGKHIATTHCVKENESGKVLHWDAKDLWLRDVCLWRPGAQPLS